MMERALRAADAADAGRKCVRCHADVHASDGPHLCKDLAARLKRQQQAVGAVKAILDKYYHPPTWNHETVALEIIKAIGGRDNGL